jgi:type II secretory ATPase GspE/PulE/Tfp pilus assembly ATPase PilB-like protein
MFWSNPGREDMRVRFRKDGVLMHYRDIPRRFRSSVVSRIEIIS